MKQCFLREKNKKELFTAEHYPITIPREYEEEIHMLKSMIATDDRSSSSHEECSSHEDTEREELNEKEKKAKKRGGEERKE